MASDNNKVMIAVDPTGYVMSLDYSDGTFVHCNNQQYQNNEWSSVTYAPDKNIFVAIAKNSNSVFCMDANLYLESFSSSYVVSTDLSSRVWSAIAYGDGKFKAVARNSTTAGTSDNGTSWTEESIPQLNYGFW